MIPEQDLLPHDCRPVGEILDQIGGKWTVLIINRLNAGPLRFSDLKRDIGGITQKVLTSTLRSLEMDGLVTRRVTPTIPPRVDYELTALGRDLQRPLNQLSQWAVENRPHVLAARQRYLAENPGAVPPRKGRVATARPVRQAAE